MIDRCRPLFTQQGATTTTPIVRRCPIIDQPMLEAVLYSGQVFSAALDVFETEPLFMDTSLLSHPRCVLGSNNASNTA